MLMKLNDFRRLRNKARRAYFDGLTAAERQVGSTGAPEVLLLREDGKEIWAPIGYCGAQDFTAQELAEMVKVAKKGGET
jgi:hypothetical protein